MKPHPADRPALSPDRRSLLHACGGVAAWSLLPRRRTHRGALDDLVQRLIDTPRERLFAMLEPELANGLTWRTLEAAVFLAATREVRPRPVGFKLHAVLVSESVFQLAEAGAPEDALLGVLWHADDFKHSQRRDVDEGDWVLGPEPTALPSHVAPEAAARELADALRAGDAERADRAVLVAHGALTHDALFEILWPFALRDYSNLGHKPIYALHVDRVLRRIGDAHARPALRALVYGLLDGEPQGGDANRTVPAADARLDVYERSSLAADRVAPAPAHGDATTSWELALDLRDAKLEDAPHLLTDAWSNGAGEARLWDGIRLAAADLFARRPSLLPVHPVTVTNALHGISKRTSHARTRRVALVQAASWIPLFRRDLVARVGLSMDSERGLEALREGVPLGRASAAFESMSGANGRNAQHLVEARVRSELFRGVAEHHEPKYAAAVLEDLQSTDPTWHSLLLAHAFNYLPSESTRSNRIADDNRALVRRVLS